ARLAGERARAEPLLAGRLVSRHTAAVGVNVALEIPLARAGETRRAVTEARRIVDDLRENHPELRVGLTGIAAINDAFAVATRQDLQTLLPLMLSVLVVAMILLLRSVRGTVLALLGVSLSALIAMGVAGWLGVKLTPSTAAAPIIILTVAVADAMHLLIGYFSARRDGLPRRPALARSMDEHAWPIFLTSLTTAIAFLALNSSNSPQLRYLGSMAAFGVMCAWLFTVLVLPVLVMQGPPAMGAAFRKAQRSLHGLARFLIARRRVAAVVVVAVLLPLGAQTFSLRINETFYKDFGERVPVRADTEFAIDRLSGPCNVMWMLDTGKAGGVHDPAFMARADGFVRWLEQQEDVAHVTAATTLLRRIDAAVVLGTEPGEGVLPERADAIEAYLSIYADTSPEGRGLRQLVSADRSALRVMAVLGDVDNARLRAVTTGAEAYLRDHVPTAAAPLSTGACSMFAVLAHRNIRAMFLGTGLAFGLIALCLMGALASIRLGLVSLVPNALPPFVAFGVWALLYDEVGLAASVVTATSLGVIVDATVHILTHYRAARIAGMPPDRAISHSLGQCGTAIGAGAVILISGFAMLGLSSFRVTQDLGLLTATALTVAIIVDFLLLPPLLLLTERQGRKTPRE
ncbi:MAG: efflux RND transporter permease subunit, partial [Alphaproteobacteria bacterium]